MALLLALFLGGCLNIHTDRAYDKAYELTRESQWVPTYIETAHFTLKSYLSPKRSAPDLPLIAYIEGDGSAWIDVNRISPDPTPQEPFMLSVALQDTTFDAVYIARPCQYVINEGKGVNCQYALWTDGRFNEVVIADMNEAIDKALKQKNRQNVILVGGSGGATVAMLVAARRTDVQGIVSLAGLLNHTSWTRHHKITPLAQSLDTDPIYSQILTVPQIHVMGKGDTIIPNALSINEINKMKKIVRARILYRVEQDLDHDCCWGPYWGKYHQPILQSLIQKRVGS
ncbi:MAG: alpha/beta fold hydrolase [Terasakiella sp.]|uniref:alpha/beta fold hydrolase n=1 Tax=unclassified Terasakiella TaxID=2614952 RepID=UPI003AFFB047